MRIVLTGGGSGGHIIPILAVAHELKQIDPNLEIIFIGQAGDKLADIPAQHKSIDRVYAVQAGKFRRYHGEGWKQLLDIRTQALNVRDAFRVIVGIVQSFWLLRRLQPGVIFTRGGFVSVPVAIGGKLNGIPYLTHDSDSTPSLANRMISRWAALHAVALPVDLYPYPKKKTIMVGIPVDKSCVPVTKGLKLSYRAELGIEGSSRVLFVTGGGNGARQLNDAVIGAAGALLAKFKDLVIVHLSGRAHYDETNLAYDDLNLGPGRARVKVEGFVSGMYRYSGAADVIVARGGASGLAEFAVQGKACVIIPARQLIWQTHHAGVLAGRNAIVCLSEAESQEPGRLESVIGDLLEHEDKRSRLAESLSTFGRTDAAHRLAVLLLEQTRLSV